MENEFNETVNNVCENVTKTKGGLAVKILVGATGVAAAIGTGIFLKLKNNKKKHKANNEIAEKEIKIVDVEDSSTEE